MLSWDEHLNGYKSNNACLMKIEKILKDERKKNYDSASTYKEIYISKLANKQTFDIVLCDGKRRIEVSSLLIFNGIGHLASFNIDSSNRANLSISSTQTPRANDSLEKKITLGFEGKLKASKLV